MKSKLNFPLVLGHRGYRAKYPENTLLAFRKAFEHGADGVECDLQKTADGRYVVIHDGDTKRVSGVDRQVGTTRFEELRGLDFGSGERIPELAELLAIIPPGKYLDLELKDETLQPEDAPAIMEILSSRIERKNLMISSFEIGLLVPFRRLGYTVGYLVGKETLAKGLLKLFLLILRRRPQYMNLPIQALAALGEKGSRRFLGLLAASGFSLLFWTVNKASEAEAVASRTRILVSDEVEVLVRLRDAEGTPA